MANSLLSSTYSRGHFALEDISEVYKDSNPYSKVQIAVVTCKVPIRVLGELPPSTKLC